MGEGLAIGFHAIGARVEEIWSKAASRNLARQIKKLGLKND